MIPKIYEFLNNCYKDSLVEQISGIEFQMFLLSTKSLIPYEDKIGCMFDTSRYQKEVEVFSYYKNGEDDSINYYLKYKKPSTIDDRLIEWKIIPIAIANTKWNILIEEVLKNIIFYTYNKQTILSGILLSSMIFDYFSLDNIDEKYIQSKMRERIIDFSIKEYFEKNYTSTINKNYLIGFEKERIQMISCSNFFLNDRLMKFKAYQYIINGEIDKKDINQDNKEVLNNFSSYLYKLRKGTVNPEKLNIGTENIPEFRTYLKNSSFNHPLLGKCLVISRGVGEIILRTKSGTLKVRA